MQKNSNSVWQFFASVNLALVTLFLIAVTSIIGTVIPQKEALEWYAAQYGPRMAQLFTVLDIPDMYNSWWFLALLCLLSLNLVICSIDRFPGVWKQIKADGFAYDETRLAKMANTQSWLLAMPVEEGADKLRQRLAEKGWKSESRPTENGVLLFSQKGAWSRTGVYLVHSSILIIFVGAIIGSLLGFKGSVMIPETIARDRIFLFGSGEPVDLGFEVRNNQFTIEFYPNGMPKEYTSNLTVIEDGTEVTTTDIEVNAPLTYKGITFYQSSYEAYQDFVITIEIPETGKKKSFIAGFQKKENWPEENLTFGVINARAMGQSVVSSKIWFSAGDNAPVTEWVENNTPLSFQSGGTSYLVSAKQMYATGLQVAKDPGVWWVYLGCGLMMLGLWVAFFMSHRRIWLLIKPAEEGSQVLLAGSANKNRPGFEQRFHELEQHLLAL